MHSKGFLRNKFFSRRKKLYFEINYNFFLPLIKLIKKIYKNKPLNISLYYPYSYEINVLKIFNNKFFYRYKFLLPVIEKNGIMNFYKWKKNDTLLLNKFGIPEPLKSKIVIPNVILIPLLAFDRKKNRLGYGKGFYDKYLNKFFKKNKKILAIGVAFSFQKYNNLPVKKSDFKLDYILTEKGVFE